MKFKLGDVVIPNCIVTSGYIKGSASIVDISSDENVYTAENKDGSKFTIWRHPDKLITNLNQGINNFDII